MKPDAGPNTFYTVFKAPGGHHFYDAHFAIMKAKVSVARPAVTAEPDDMYGDQPYMLNLRVADLDSVCRRLVERGVKVIKREDEVFGRFAWVRDIDGNRVELYEPKVSEKAAP